MIRAIIYFAILMVLSHFLNKWSREQDAHRRTAPREISGRHQRPRLDPVGHRRRVRDD